MKHTPKSSPRSRELLARNPCAFVTPDRRRRAAIPTPPPRTYAAATLCAAAGVEPVTLRSWRAKGWLVVAGAGDGWTRYNTEHLMRAVAIAELARHGIPPGAGRTLAGVLELDLVALAEGRRYAKQPLFALAHRLDADERDLVVRSGLTAAGVAGMIRSLARDGYAATAVVVDVAKLFRRVARTLVELDEA